MTYNETTWKTGDKITADKLNNIERGVNCATGLVVSFYYDTTSETFYADKTFGEVRKTFESGTPVFFIQDRAEAEGYDVKLEISAVRAVSYSIANGQATTAEGLVTAAMDWFAHYDPEQVPETLEELDECELMAT